MASAALSPPVAARSVLGNAEIQALVSGQHGDPFARLGMHLDDSDCLWVRVLLPTAARVGVIDAGPRRTDADAKAVLKPIAKPDRVLKWLEASHPDGLFEAIVPRRSKPFRYRLRVQWSKGVGAGVTLDLEDPYRFAPLLGDLDLWLLGEGRHLRPYERLGAHPRTIDGVAGTTFAVWAPNARRVSVVGDFNFWDGRRHPMRLRPEAGVWEIFLPAVSPGAHYKFELLGPDGERLPLRADPYAMRAELRPATASIVAELPPMVPAANEARRQANAFDAPIAIYEVHAGSWRRKVEEGNRFLNWDELADELIPYVQHMGFTHIELMPVAEHPFDGSWGYQSIGLYAPTARHGPPERLRAFIERCHAAGIGVLLDWVPAHFPNDEHGLARFDSTPLYEHADPREGIHKDWDTLIYNFGRHEVINYLTGNALYWIERFGFDGLRVDAVASMLYRDYSREPGEWIPNQHGGRENLEAIGFIRRLNETVGIERTEAVMIAEESTSWPMVTRPPSAGGLGFHYKWNLGWMHDTLQYLHQEPVHRRYHHDKLTFGLLYAFNENFMLPLSHDEVVHGKGSLLAKMPGDRWQQFANLRMYLGFMYAYPGKKLLFMGIELAQLREWHHDISLDWHLLESPMHRGVQTLVRDLNHLYRKLPALHQRDFRGDGFEWIDHHDRDQSIISFIRRADGDRFVVAVCNFTPVPRNEYRIGVPCGGHYQEVLNTDSGYYGGSNLGNLGGGALASDTPAHGHPFSLSLTLPPLATLLLEWTY